MAARQLEVQWVGQFPANDTEQPHEENQSRLCLRPGSLA
jgi:hypothetical protein